MSIANLFRKKTKITTDPCDGKLTNLKKLAIRPDAGVSLATKFMECFGFARRNPEHILYATVGTLINSRAKVYTQGQAYSEAGKGHFDIYIIEFPDGSKVRIRPPDC